MDGCMDGYEFFASTLFSKTVIIMVISGAHF